MPNVLCRRNLAMCGLLSMGLFLCVLISGPMEARAATDAVEAPSLKAAIVAGEGADGPMRLIVSDVVASYDSYSCSKSISAHNISGYNYNYKKLSYKNGYTRTESTTKNYVTGFCADGGIRYHHVFTYSTY
ncbi:hypothetical protein [Granulimonas faecalis]|uniref:hypothetical protein n=1 Tax=Granulimonas faecalis TaxID=2894155 RepID=UPI0035126729